MINDIRHCNRERNLLLDEKIALQSRLREIYEKKQSRGVITAEFKRKQKKYFDTIYERITEIDKLLINI